MFQTRKSALSAELSALVLQGAQPELIGRKFSEASSVGVNSSITYDLAKRYGASLKCLEDVSAFYRGVTSSWESGGSLDRFTWHALGMNVAIEYWKVVGVKSAKEAIILGRFITGWKEQKEIIKQALPLLHEETDIVEFACVLSTPEALMILAIGLSRDVPMRSFEEAVAQRRRRQQEDDDRRRRERDNLSAL